MELVKPCPPPMRPPNRYSEKNRWMVPPLFDASLKKYKSFDIMSRVGFAFDLLPLGGPLICRQQPILIQYSMRKAQTLRFCYVSIVFLLRFCCGCAFRFKRSIYSFNHELLVHRTHLWFSVCIRVLRLVSCLRMISSFTSCIYELRVARECLASCICF